MKYIDKRGNFHKTRIAMYCANFNRILDKHTKPDPEYDKLCQDLEEEWDAFLDMVKNHELSDAEVDMVVASMMHRLDDPIQSFLKGDLNSEIGERKFFEMMFMTVWDEFKKNPGRFAKSYEAIVKAFAGELVKIIGLRHKYDNTDAVG